MVLAFAGRVARRQNRAFDSTTRRKAGCAFYGCYTVGMNGRRGSIALFAIVALALAGAIAWWVVQGEPGLTVGTASHAGQALFKADQTQGPPPLGVTFSIARDLGTVQTVNYGDGTSADISDFVCGLTYCVRLHTYTIPGRYTVTLEDAGGSPVGSPLTITVVYP